MLNTCNPTRRNFGLYTCLPTHIRSALRLYVVSRPFALSREAYHTNGGKSTRAANIGFTASIFYAYLLRGVRAGVPGGTRTPDLLLRRQLLYPAELQAHMCYVRVFAAFAKLFTCKIFRDICSCGAGEGNRTLVTSLEGWNSTIELHPRKVPFQSELIYHTTFTPFCQGLFQIFPRFSHILSDFRLSNPVFLSRRGTSCRIRCAHFS